MKTISFLSCIWLVFLLTGCRDSDPDTEYVLGNPDAGSLCFAADELLIECEDSSSVCDLFFCDDKLCLIVKNSLDQDNNDTRSNYTAVLIDPGSEEVIDKFSFNIPDYSLVSFCYAGDNRIACSKLSNGYIIVDMADGTLVYDKTVPGIGSIPTSVSSADDGFVFVSDGLIAKVSSEGEIMNSIPFSADINEIPRRNACFTVNGRFFVSVDRNMEMSYYELDLGREYVSDEPVALQSDLDLSWPALFNYGQFAYDQFANTIYEIDPYSKTRSTCSLLENMLISPEQGALKSSSFYVLDKVTYANIRQYYGSLIGIQIIKPDHDLDLTGREKITVRGDNATMDRSLAYAAYSYNTSQDEYYVVIQNYGEEYGYETIDEAQARTLRLIQDFQRGDAPDIFYGNSFDYIYMGEHGLVTDLKPFIDSGAIVDRSMLSENIADMLFRNDHCYQIFSGYSLFGLFGDDGLQNNIDDYLIYEDPRFAETINGRYPSADLVNFMIGYTIRSIDDLSRLNDHETVENMLNIAVTNGISPGEQQNGQVYNDAEYTSLADVGSFQQYSMLSSFRREIMAFYGFPTIDTTCYLANPKCLVAVSASTTKPEACIDFLSYMFTDGSQRTCLYNNSIPVVERTLDTYFNYMEDPGSVPEDDISLKTLIPNTDPSANRQQDRSEVVTKYEDAVRSVNGILTYDWGIYGIIFDEVNSYYLQNRDVSTIADSLINRLDLYIEENGI